jgi:hypothetical protein
MNSSYQSYCSEMKKTICQSILLLLGFICVTATLSAQKKPENSNPLITQLIETNFTVKNGSSESFYFGLAKGDKISFSSDASGSSIKKMEFSAYPDSEIFREDNMDSIQFKTIDIPQTGIYYFRFQQWGFLAGRRYCSLSATREAGSEATANFNTTVYWESKTDTVWYEEEEKYLIRIDTFVTQIADQTISLKKNGKADRSLMMFSLPDSLDGWAIWIGTGKDANTHFANTENQMSSINPIVRKHGLMASLAMNGNASFVTPPGCLPVSFWVLSAQEEMDKFNGPTIGTLPNKKTACINYSRSTTPMKGISYLGLYNETPKKLDIFMKIVSVNIVENWGTRMVRKSKIETTQVPYLKN